MSSVPAGRDFLLAPRVMTGVRKGRERLAVELPSEETEEEDEERVEVPVFDQDVTSQPDKAH